MSSNFDSDYKSIHKLIYSEIRKRLAVHPVFTQADYDDLFQDISISLFRTYKTYDRTKGAYTTYAFLVIQGGITSFLRHHLKAKRNKYQSVSYEALVESGELV